MVIGCQILKICSFLIRNHHPMRMTVFHYLPFLLLLLYAFPGSLTVCPTVCSCDTDSLGRKRVRCDRGDLSVPSNFKPENIDRDTLVLVISAPAGKTNNIVSLKPDNFKGLLLQEVHISDTEIRSIGDRTFFYLSHTLKVLDLARNRILFLHENNFRNLSGLTHLHLDSNEITDVHSATFNYQRTLKVLTLSNNRITNIGSRLLLQQASLEVIDLSGNPLYDTISESGQGAIPELIFPDAPNLRRLSLANTGISSLPFAAIARSCASLEELDVSTNNFTVISPGQFNQMKSLRSLILAGNDGLSIKAGAFQGMVLDNLDLSSTGIVLTSNIFDGSTVRYLSIALNNLQTIDITAFQPIAQDLIGIAIGGNPLTLKERMFQFLPNLKSLSLSKMRVARLPKDFFAYTHKITNFNVSGNMLQDLDDETLAVLPNLEVLDISNNELKALPYAAAKSSLRELYASNNKLKKVSDYFVDRFASTSSKFRTLRIFGNPIDCDWSVGALANWVGTPSGRLAVCGIDAGFKCPICAAPKELSGRPIDEVKVSVA